MSNNKLAVYQDGELYLILRGDKYQVHGTLNGHRIRKSCGTRDFGTARIFLHDLKRRHTDHQKMPSERKISPATMAILEERLAADWMPCRHPSLLRRRRRTQRRPVIYFIEARGFIKIGYSEEWQRRAAEIQSLNPAPIKVLSVLDGSIALEQSIHQIFAKHRTSGEWFYDHPDIRDYIADHRHECWYADHSEDGLTRG